MKTFNFLCLAVAVSSLVNSSSFAFDVTSELPHESRYIKVEKSGTEAQLLVSFQMCDRETDVCTQIGKQKFYKVDSLKVKRENEYLKGTGKAVGALAVGAGVGAVGFYGGLAIAYSSTVITLDLLTTAQVGATAGALVGAGASQITNAINPIYSFKRAYKLRDEVILDKAVTTDKIEKFAEDLRQALDQ